MVSAMLFGTVISDKRSEDFFRREKTRIRAAFPCANASASGRHPEGWPVANAACSIRNALVLSLHPESQAVMAGMQ